MDMDLPLFPKRLEIELVSDCNLKCTYCPRNSVEHPLDGHMDLKLLRKVVDEAAAYPDTIIVLHRRGESMMHPQFNEAFGAVAGKFKEVQMATNATLLTPDKFEALVRTLNFLSFSLDAPDNFNKTRLPAKYAPVERKILKFLEFNQGRVKTQASMVRTGETAPEHVEAFKAVWSGRVDRVRVYEEHSVGGVFGAMHHPREKRQPCVMPFYEILIYDDGKVGRCNHDWDSEPMGEVNTHSIADVWRSARYQNLRREHLGLTFNDPVCRGCDAWYPKERWQGTGELVER